MYLINISEEIIPIRRSKNTYGIFNGSLWIIKGTMAARRASAGMNLNVCQFLANAGQF
jgi:hypothetical protein